MEHGYGIGITNRYSCFLESDDDPSESLKLTEADKDSKKKGKIAEKENQKIAAELTSTPKISTIPSTGSSQNQRKGIRDSNIKGGGTNEPQQRINRFNPESGDRGNRGPRPDRQNSDYIDRRPRPTGDDREERNNRRNQEDNRDYRRDDTEGRGGIRRGGFRGGRGGVPFGRGRGAPGPYRKREFDRQSGSDKSGVKSVDKRDGAGSRNWGNYKDDDLDREVTTVASPEESMEEKPDAANTIQGEGEHGDTEKTAEEETPAPVEEEAKLMTLGEWKALQEQQARPKPVFNLRKAGEGEDQSQWKKMTLKTKEKENQEGEIEEEEGEEYDYPQRAGRQKQLLDIDFHFPDSRHGMAPSFSGPPRGDSKSRPRRPESDRGGRGFGGPRGVGAFRGGFRGGRGFSNRDDRPTRQMAPKVDDERDFPSLG